MNKIFNELEKYCDKHSVKLQIDEFPKDKNRFEITLDNFIYEELSDIRNIIRDFAKIEDDVHLAGNGRAIDIYIENLNESKKMKEHGRRTEFFDIQHISGSEWVAYPYDKEGDDIPYDKIEYTSDGHIYAYVGNKIIDKDSDIYYKYRDEIIDAIEDDGYDVYIAESKKSTRKGLKESVDGKFATDKECNMSGKGWILEGTYNFIMEFLQEWGIAPTDVIPQKHDMLALYNADGNVFGYCHHDDEVDIFVVDKDINYFWKNYKPSTKRVKVTEMDDNWY